MNEQDMEFIAIVYSKIVELEKMVVAMGYEDRVMSAIVFGLMDTEGNEDNETVEMRSLHSYNLESKEELETIKDIMDATYEAPDDGFMSLFDGTGISLN